MFFGFMVVFITTYALAVILAVINPTSLMSALQISIFLCFAFVVTTKFSELIYESREPHWSKRPQMLFLISCGYQIGHFVIATVVIWFFMNGMHF
jgi:magnesium-transporting ATPase (P-type)